VRRTTPVRLADGRELRFYDESGAPPREATDVRELPPRATRAEVRYDPLLDEWVAMASHRQSRTHLPPADECPLCPSRPGHATEVPADDYEVVVFENRFPSFASDGATAADGTDADVHGPLLGGLVPRLPGRGRCEVVCFTPEHDSSFAALSPARARTVVEAWADRTEELGRVPGVEQVFCFENRGEEIGVTLHHPHGQIYAYPFVTPRTRRMLDTARAHRERTGRHLLDDVLAAERADGRRVVAANAHWTAYVPAAARWPVEVHLVPHRGVPDLPALDDAERDAFCTLYLDVLRRLDALYDAPLPYVSAWHQAPVRADRDLARLHLQVFSIRRAADKLKYLAGSESGMGAFVTDVLPEDVAARLREARP
jgi:UDPglucose--hexose-1-phosphate uridylyltransferase